MTRTEWILGILLGTITIIAVASGLVIWRGPETTDAVPGARVAMVPTSAFQSQTTMVAYTLAQQQALRWQPDAMLIKASATWPQGADSDELLSGASTWSLAFYSADTSSVVNVTANGHKVTLVNKKLLEGPLTTPPISSWRVDSAEAIRTLLGEGGSEFLAENNVSTLTAVLSTTNSSGRIEWLMSIFSVQNGSSFTMRLDADSGEVLEVLQTTNTSALEQ